MAYENGDADVDADVGGDVDRDVDADVDADGDEDGDKRMTGEKKTTSDDPFVRMVQNAAAHCAAIMTEGAPCVYRCSIRSQVYQITIEPRRPYEDEAYLTLRYSDGKTANVWDQVWIALAGEEGRGTWCGNRCGGRETLAGLYADEIKKAARTS